MSGCGTGTFTPDDTPSPIVPVTESNGENRPEVLAGCCSEGSVVVPDDGVTEPTIEETPVTAAQGLREFLEDFNTATHFKTKANLLIRPDAVSYDYLTAYSFGPKDIADVTGGAQNRVWRAVATNEGLSGFITISRANDDNTAWIDEQVLFSYVGTATEIDLAFEQAARAVICMEIDGKVWLYWFDPVPGDFVLEEISTGRTPRVILDDPIDTTISDVLLFYVNDSTGIIEFRQQRDGYAIVYDTDVVTADEDYYLEEIFRARDNRIVFIYSVRNQALGQYTLHRVESTLYPFTSDVDLPTASVTLLSGSLPVIVIDYSEDPEIMDATISILSGILADVILLETLFDTDILDAEISIESGTLVVVVITHTAFDLDELEAIVTIESGTLVIVVIEHTCFDIDNLDTGVTILGGTLA